MSWLTEQFTLLGAFFRRGFRRTVLWCALGMVIAALLGFAVSLLFPEIAWEMMDAFAQQVAESGVLDDAGEMSVYALLMNNWRAMLISALYGLIPFLFRPLISLMSNGALLGVLAGLYQANGMSVLALLAGVVPHGIFELPALVFSVACGIRLCKNMCLMVVSSPKKIPFPVLAEDLLRVLVLVIAPLTVAAAFVECYITPVVMDWFM